MEKIGLLEDINKSKSNPDVRQRERSGQPLSIKSHGGQEGGGENCRKASY